MVKLLGKRSVIRPPRQLLTERTKKLKLERCRRILNYLKNSNMPTIKIFSNKKIFTVDQAYNRQNDCYIVDHGSPAFPVNRTKHPAGVMMLGIIASNGNKCPPIFIDEGAKVNAERYVDLLKQHWVPG